MKTALTVVTTRPLTPDSMCAIMAPMNNTPTSIYYEGDDPIIVDLIQKVHNLEWNVWHLNNPVRQYTMSGDD